MENKSISLDPLISNEHNDTEMCSDKSKTSNLNEINENTYDKLPSHPKPVSKDVENFMSSQNKGMDCESNDFDIVAQNSANKFDDAFSQNINEYDRVCAHPRPISIETAKHSSNQPSGILTSLGNDNDNIIKSLGLLSQNDSEYDKVSPIARPISFERSNITSNDALVTPRFLETEAGNKSASLLTQNGSEYDRVSPISRPISFEPPNISNNQPLVIDNENIPCSSKSETNTEDLGAASQSPENKEDHSGKVPGTPHPVKKDQVVIQEIEKDDLTNRVSCVSLDKEKRSSRSVKKTDSVKALVSKTSSDNKKVHRSTSFTKRALQKLGAGKHEKQAEDDEHPVMIDKAHGMLYLRKKKLFCPWRKYFFVMDGSQLTYYANMEQYHRLTGCHGSVDLTLLESLVKKKPSTCFRRYYPLLLGRRSLTPLYLGAESASEQDRWFELLQRALNTRKAASEKVRKISKAATQANSPDVVSSNRPLHTEDETKGKQRKKSGSFKRSFSFSKKSGGERKDSCSEESERIIDEHIVAKSPEVESSKNVSENITEDKADEDEILIKPKKILKTGIPIPGVTSDILNVKLKKANECTITCEKVQDLKTPKEAEVDFGVKLKKTGITSTHLEKKVNKSESSDIEFDFRSVLRSAKEPVRVARSSASSGTSTLKVNKKNRSPSPSLPLSKSLKSVLDKSTDEKDLVFEDQANNDKLDEENASSEVFQSEQNEIQGICTVNHAVAEKIRYSDPPVELKLAEVVVTPMTSFEISTVSSEKNELVEMCDILEESDDLNKQVTMFADTTEEKIIGNADENIPDIMTCNSQMEEENPKNSGRSEISLPQNYEDEKLPVTTEVVSKAELILVTTNEDKNSDTLNPVILDNESSISLSPVPTREITTIEKTTHSFEYLDVLLSNVGDRTGESSPESNGMSSIGASVEDLGQTNSKENIQETNSEEAALLSVSEWSRSETEQINDEEFEIIEYSKNVEDIHKCKNPKLTDCEVNLVKTDENRDDKRPSSLQEYPSQHQEVNTLDVSYQPQNSMERSYSVESNEPLPRTSFMGGRRSWSSVSNYDPKIESNSESTESRNSIDVPLRAIDIENEHDIIFVGKNIKRNSSGYAESIAANEHSFARRSRVRPISNPIISNRESLIAPEFVLHEETEGFENSQATKNEEEGK